MLIAHVLHVVENEGVALDDVQRPCNHLFHVADLINDDALELMGNTFIDLKDSQFMLGVSAKYSPMDNWKLNMSVSKFMGDEGTQFNEMEDFSHLKVGLEFHF